MKRRAGFGYQSFKATPLFRKALMLSMLPVLSNAAEIVSVPAFYFGYTVKFRMLKTKYQQDLWRH